MQPGWRWSNDWRCLSFSATRMGYAMELPSVVASASALNRLVRLLIRRDSDPATVLLDPNNESCQCVACVSIQHSLTLPLPCQWLLMCERLSELRIAANGERRIAKCFAKTLSKLHIVARCWKNDRPWHILVIKDYVYILTSTFRAYYNRVASATYFVAYGRIHVIALQHSA